jgi:hypothetical protein
MLVYHAICPSITIQKPDRLRLTTPSHFASITLTKVSFAFLKIGHRMKKEKMNRKYGLGLRG